MIQIGTNGAIFNIEELSELSEQELRNVLLAIKNVQKEISELVVEKARTEGKEDISLDQTKVITDEVKKGNIDNAKLFYKTFTGGTDEQAETYVKVIEDNLEDLDIPEVQKQLRKLKIEHGLKG